MVNTDLHSNQTSANTPVSTAVQTAVVRLGRLLTNKLLESGSSHAANLLACEQSEIPSHEEHELYLTQLDCEFLNNFRNITVLSSLAQHYAATEDRLLSLLAQRARCELNTISEDPPFATRLAHESEYLLSVSPLRGLTGKNLCDLETKLYTAMQNSLSRLLSKSVMGWTDIMRAEPCAPASELLFWANNLLNAISTLEINVSRLDSHFSKDPAEDGGRGNAKTYRQIVRQKHHKVQKRMPLNTLSIQRLHAMRWEDDASQHIMERNFYEFGLLAESILMQIKVCLDVWDKNETHRSARVKSRQIGTENFFYADGIRRSLYQLGESLDDAMSCAEKLLQYCSDSGVAAAELIDDEIWSLYPRINRENLKQARLRVRHSDGQFPLSVAHREWISRLTEQALAKRVPDAESQANPHPQAQEQTHKTFHRL